MSSLGILRYNLIKRLQYPSLYGGIGVKPVDVPSDLTNIRNHPLSQGHPQDAYLPGGKKALERYINAFRDYIAEKEKTCLKLKYKGKRIDPEFLFLDAKLKAIGKAIVKELGSKALNEIKNFYEQEMILKISRGVKHK